MRPETPLYFIALIPEPDITERIQEIRFHLREKYGLNYALRLPPHITLQTPFQNQLPEKDFEKVINSIRERFKGMRLTTNGFGSFIESVLYIGVNLSPELAELQEWLADHLTSMRCLNLSQGNNDYIPHITLAHRDLDRKVFAEIWHEYKDLQFHEEFFVRELAIFRHDQRAWNIAGSIRDNFQYV